MAASEIVDLRLQNISSLAVRGLDFDSTLDWHSPWADLRWSVGGTYLLAYDAINTPGSPSVSLLNRIGQPVDLNLQTTLRARRQKVSAAATFNYTNHYRNTLVQPIAPISSWSTVDLWLTYRAGERSATDEPTGWEFGVAIRNALNRAPPVALDPIAQISFDPANATVYGRKLSMFGRLRW